MVRFKQDICDEDEVIWQKGNIYRIIDEEEDQVIVEHDSIKQETYSIQKTDLGTYCLIYICHGEINKNCKYCKYLGDDKKENFCEILKKE